MDVYLPRPVASSSALIGQPKRWLFRIAAATFGMVPMDAAAAQSADLAVTHTAVRQIVGASEPVEFELVVNNHGPDTVDGALLSVPLTTGFTVEHVNCVATDADQRCPKTLKLPELQGDGLRVPALAPGQNMRLSVQGVADDNAKTFVQTATATSPSGVIDPNPGNNKTQIQITIGRAAPAQLPRSPYFAGTTDGAPSATGANIGGRDSPDAPRLPQVDLVVEKQGPAVAEQNSPLAFSITVTNHGPEAADGAVLTDAAVPNYGASTLSCSAVDGAACPPASSVWDLQGNGVVIPTLPNGSAVTFTLQGNVETGTGNINNSAAIRPPAGSEESNEADNTDTAVVAVPSIRLTKTATSLLPTGTQGLYVARFTVVVVNQGTGASTYGELTDTLEFPAQLAVERTEWDLDGGQGGRVDGPGPYVLASEGTTIGAGGTDTYDLRVYFRNTNPSLPIETCSLVNTASLPDGQEAGTGDNSACLPQQPPTVRIANAPTVTEGGMLGYTATLSAASIADTTVNIELDGTATAVDDYTLPDPLSATIPAGETSVVFSIGTLADALFEGNETVIASLQAGAGYTVGTPDTGTGTITDAQTAPTVNISDAAAVVEGATLNYPVTLSNASTVDTVVNLILGGTASAGGDYTEPALLSVTIPAGATSAPLPIVTLSDAIFEGDETVTVTLQPGTGYSVGTPDTGTGTITDAQTAPAVTIANAATVTEGGTLGYTVTLSNASTVSTVVNFGLGGTASAGSDYSAPSPLNVTIPAGAISALIQVATLTDVLFEGDETVTLTLQAGSGYTVGAPATGSGTIADAQAAPLASIANAATVTEGGTLSYAVTLSGASTAMTVVNFSLGGTATSGSDYTPPSPLTITIPAGAITASFPVITPTDALFEGDETVTVTLQAGTGYGVGTPATGSGTIADSQGEPIATIANAPAVTEGGTLSYAVTLSNASTTDTVIPFVLAGTASAGSDYTTPSPLNVTILAGATSALIPVITLADASYEGDETVTIALQPGTGYTIGTPGTGSGTIADAQGLPVATIANAAAVTEGGTLSYTVSLSNISAANTVINIILGGSATGGSDYTAPTQLSVTVPAGATGIALAITTLTDTAYEGDETLTVTLQAGTGYSVGTPGVGSGTITDGQQQVVATDDIGSIGGAAGGVAIANVLGNDTLGGAPAVMPQASLEALSSSSRALFLTASGEARVLPTTPAGVYTLRYQLCETASPGNCAQANVTVTVTPAVIDATNDIQGELIIGSRAAQAPINAFGNDTLDGQPLDTSLIQLTTLSIGPVTVQPDGTVLVQAETAAGAYDVEYQICEALNTGNCDNAVVSITILAATIDAADDSASVPQNAGALVAVIANDQFDGQPVDPTVATVTIVGSPVHGAATIDSEKRVVYTPTAHFSGVDSLRYELCESAEPNNCAAATVTITVAPNRVAAVDDSAQTEAATAITIAVLANDTTLSAPLDPASIDIVSPPGRGNVTCANGSCEYVPSAGRAAAGSDNFIYRVCDVSIPNPVCGTAVVSIAIAAGTASLRISKQATPRQAKPGDLVRYTLTVQNVGDVAAVDTTLVDVPPAGFGYVNGSLNVDDGDDVGRVDGVAPLRIGGIDVAIGATATVRYFLRVSAGVGPGRHRNTVVAVDSNGAPISNEGSAEVEITGDPLFEDSLIIGTVFDDRDGDGWQDPPDERGVPGVRLVSVEGLVIETDAYGRFHVAGVPGGNATRGYNFILKVDRATLPPGTEFTTENPRVKRITPGLPARFDFGIRLPAASGSEP